MRVFIIAEIGQAHDGSLGILHSFIDAVAGTGVDAIKFQTHIAEAESSIYEPFRTPFSFEDKTRFEYWKRMEFTFEQWFEIKRHCEEKGLIFISTPSSNAAIDILEKIDTQIYKIGSGDISNHLLIEKVAITKKDVILSSGMSDFTELDEAVGLLGMKSSNLSILQCTTQYPTNPQQLGLNVISELRDRYNCKVGLSDHSGLIYPSIAAVALGAEIIEVHVTFDKKMFGPDSTSSLTINELKMMVEGSIYIRNALNYKVDKNNISSFVDLKKIFGKSLSVNKDLPKGHVLEFKDLESKKPSGYGIPCRQYKSILGKKLNKSKRKNDFLTEEDLN